MLLSRTGGGGATTFLDSLMSSGSARVEAPPCDITQLASLGSVFASLRENMPPIKGCIQAAVTVKVGLS